MDSMAQKLILVTGATGHLGFRVLILLLQHGYRARITYRQPGQVEKLKRPASMQPFHDAIEFTHVPDITVSDAYDKAVLGVDSIIHIASPIYTGLVAYDLRNLPDTATLAEAPNSEIAYVYSKVLSHIAATRFAESHRSFDLVRVLPAYIQGANELYTSAEEMSDSSKSGSNEGIMNTALGNVLDLPRTNAQVLLEDVAKAHILALRPEVAEHGDNLPICGNSGDSIPWREFVPIIRKQFPRACENGILDPKAEDEDRLTYFDVSISEKALGFKFAGAEEMVKSVIGQYLGLAKGCDGCALIANVFVRSSIIARLVPQSVVVPDISLPLVGSDFRELSQAISLAPAIVTLKATDNAASDSPFSSAVDTSICDVEIVSQGTGTWLILRNALAIVGGHLEIQTSSYHLPNRSTPSLLLPHVEWIGFLLRVEEKVKDSVSKQNRYTHAANEDQHKQCWFVDEVRGHSQSEKPRLPPSNPAKSLLSTRPVKCAKDVDSQKTMSMAEGFQFALAIGRRSKEHLVRCDNGEFAVVVMSRFALVIVSRQNSTPSFGWPRPNKYILSSSSRLQHTTTQPQRVESKNPSTARIRHLTLRPIAAASGFASRWSSSMYYYPFSFRSTKECALAEYREAIALQWTIRSARRLNPGDLAQSAPVDTAHHQPNCKIYNSSMLSYMSEA
nr:putative uncharacterized oxidoreductase [Quercus suber]